MTEYLSDIIRYFRILSQDVNKLYDVFDFGSSGKMILRSFNNEFRASYPYMIVKHRSIRTTSSKR